MPRKPLHIYCAQLNPIVGDLDGNADIIIKTWQENHYSHDLIIFPELFLCGYPPEDLVLNATFIQNVHAHIETIQQKSKAFEAAALIPTLWQEDQYLYNAALLIHRGHITHIFKKHKLPNYLVFDEPRTFTAGKVPDPIDFKGHKIGIMICEDLWYPEISLHLKNAGAEILIAINGSPYHIDKMQQRLDVARSCVENSALGLIYINMVGGQDELVFDGQSFVMDKDGTQLHQAHAFQNDIFTVSCNAQSLTVAAQKLNPPRESLNDIYHALCLGVRDYVHKNRFKDVLIGLSGGIDSAITAAIAVDALGFDHVRCVMMPSEFTSQESIDDAKSCADMLGVRYDIIPIKDAVTTFEAVIPDLNGLAHENTQSRLRGVILMALSNMGGAMLLTTGNKSEMAVGYCTIYGDMNGGFNPLKDVYKTDVYRIAHWRNAQSPVMPERIITKAPSAELRPDQKDEDSLPPYETLDAILKLLIDYDGYAPHDIPEHIMTLCSQHADKIEKIARLLKNSEYKRFQAAPGVRISPRAFGRDRRYPLTNGFVNNIAKDA